MANESQNNPTPDKIARRKAWFEQYTTRLEGQPAELPLRCPCCYCQTLSKRDDFEICPVCFLEDDGQDDHDADVVRSGPNGRLSLKQARSNYEEFGACDKQMVNNVRKPRSEEVR
jgi:hypothetical protein